MQTFGSTPVRRGLVCVIAALGALVAVPPVASASGGQPGTVRLLVKFRRDVARARAGKALASLGAVQVRKISPLRVRVVRVPRARAAQVLARLRESGLVAYAERDRTVIRLAQSQYEERVPNDPLFGLEWGAVRTAAPAAWAVTTGSPNVVVAVVDTGVDLAHADLQGAFVPGYDFVNNDADPSDDFGHGTGVAGIVAARSGNGLDVAGYCPRCSIMPVKVVGSDGHGRAADIAAGITWATDHGAKVVNLSLGGSQYVQTIAAAVSYALAHGVLVVGAAGNDGASNLFYPAAYPGVLSVGATDPNDQLYPWSNYGSWVNVAAPGCTESTRRGGGTGGMCGTSATAPVVAGLAGLAFSFDPAASSSRVLQAIQAGAAPTARVAFGRVDAAAMLQRLGAVLKPAPPPPPPPPGGGSAGAGGAAGGGGTTAKRRSTDAQQSAPATAKRAAKSRRRAKRRPAGRRWPQLALTAYHLRWFDPLEPVPQQR